MTLQRYAFLATGAYLGAMALIGWLTLAALLSGVQTLSEQVNRSFTRLFVNENWERLQPMLQLGSPAADLRTNPAVDEVDGVIRQFARGTDLVQVKIFDVRGVVVYATDRSLLGLDKSSSPGLTSAIKGRTWTEMTHRDQFSGYDGELQARDLVSSYVPVLGAGGVQAVVEIYTDITEAHDAADRQWRWLMGSIGLVLGAVWIGLVRGHARKLKQHRQTVDDHVRALEQQRDANREIVAAGQDTLRLLWGVSRGLEAPAQALLDTLREMTPPVVTAATGRRLEQAVGHAAVLQRRIRELSLIVQLSRGDWQPVEESFHLGDLIRQRGDLLKVSASGRKLDVLVHVSPLVDWHYLGDPERIRDVLEVLLDNALAMTTSGSIQLRALPSVQGVALEVVDTGPGLSDAQRRAFTDSEGRHCRLPGLTQAAIEDEQSHSVLRLIVAKGLARAMGGRLEARSERGHGTWFTLRLPLAIAPGGAA